jgi:hypothetical protein
LNHLARATQIQQLLKRYIALAPVHIGGPSSTSLDLLPPTTTHADPSAPWEGLAVPAGQAPQQNGISHLQVGRISVASGSKLLF